MVISPRHFDTLLFSSLQLELLISWLPLTWPREVLIYPVSGPSSIPKCRGPLVRIFTGSAEQREQAVGGGLSPLSATIEEK